MREAKNGSSAGLGLASMAAPASEDVGIEDLESAAGQDVGFELDLEAFAYTPSGNPNLKPKRAAASTAQRKPGAPSTTASVPPRARGDGTRVMARDRRHVTVACDADEPEAGGQKVLGPLLQRLQQQREAMDRVQDAGVGGVKKGGHGAGARPPKADSAGGRQGSLQDLEDFVGFPELEMEVKQGAGLGGQHAEKLRVLEGIVRACPRGPVFEFHKFLMRLKDEPHGDFLCLCAALLSVQCLDHVAMKACEKLRSEFPGDFCAMSVADTSPEIVEPLISTVNYYKGKAKKIVSCAKTIVTKHKGRVPHSEAQLLLLDGVGPKIAHLVMSVGLSIPRTGIVVDTHVHRLSARLGWTGATSGESAQARSDAGGFYRPHRNRVSAEDTRRALEEWVPPDARIEFTLALIAFGQTVCKKERPLCGECALKDLCPSREALSGGGKSEKAPFFGSFSRPATTPKPGAGVLEEREDDVIVVGDDVALTSHVALDKGIEPAGAGPTGLDPRSLPAQASDLAHADSPDPGPCARFKSPSGERKLAPHRRKRVFIDSEEDEEDEGGVDAGDDVDCSQVQAGATEEVQEEGMEGTVGKWQAQPGMLSALATSAASTGAVLPAIAASSSSARSSLSPPLRAGGDSEGGRGRKHSKLQLRKAGVVMTQESTLS